MAEGRQDERVALRIRRRFKATREKVFRAWTEAEQLRQWKAPGPARVTLAQVDLRVGGGYRIHMQAPDGTEYRLHGEYREIEPPARIVFTWQWEHEPVERETLVTVELSEHEGETELLLTHEGFQNGVQQTGHEQGWESTLDKLTACL